MSVWRRPPRHRLVGPWTANFRAVLELGPALHGVGRHVTQVGTVGALPKTTSSYWPVITVLQCSPQDLSETSPSQAAPCNCVFTNLAPLY